MLRIDRYSGEMGNSNKREKDVLLLIRRRSYCKRMSRIRTITILCIKINKDKRLGWFYSKPFLTYAQFSPPEVRQTLYKISILRRGVYIAAYP